MITNVIKNWVSHNCHFKLKRIKYTNHITYVNKVNSNKKPFFGNQKCLGIITIGPHDIQHETNNKPVKVTTSTTQKEAKPFNHNFLSPLVKRPNWVLRQTETPQT